MRIVGDVEEAVVSAAGDCDAGRTGREVLEVLSCAESCEAKQIVQTP
jgi:hypothetical protein